MRSSIAARRKCAFSRISPTLRAISRWRPVGAMAPGGTSDVVLAGTGVELARTRASAARIEAAIHPEGRRNEFGIVCGLTTLGTLAPRLERSPHCIKG